MAYYLTAAARRDLNEIWAFVARDSESAADRLIESLRERFEMLGRNPYAGRNRDDQRPGYRSFSFGEYVMFYRVTSRGAQIIRVIHGRRNISRLFN